LLGDGDDRVAVDVDDGHDDVRDADAVVAVDRPEGESVRCGAFSTSSSGPMCDSDKSVRLARKDAWSRQSICARQPSPQSSTTSGT
jgi:hypothetical protein